VPTIESIQACGYERFELFVLDQSGDDSTARAVLPLAGQDARVRYVPLATANKPRALNHGRQLASGEYILLTDDDCTVAPQWIAAFVSTLQSNPDVACVYGDVDAAPHDATLGYIPTRRITRPHTITRLSEYLRMPGHENFGMGASMAVRRTMLCEIGGWDPTIGPGAAFGSGDDNDLAVRLLAAGHPIAFSPDARVTHYGFRLWTSASRDNARYGFGMGAVFAKELRCGTFFAGGFRLLLDGLRISLRRLVKGERPLALAYPRSWVRGFWVGLRWPLHRPSRCFIDRPPSRSTGDSNRAADVVLRDEINNPPKQVRRISERPRAR
jgi:GT2 family glycosyltransferase